MWSVVFTQQSECQQLPFFCRYCNLQGGAPYLWHIHVAITLIQCCFEHRRRVTCWAPKASLSVYVYCQVLLHTEDENESHIIFVLHISHSLTMSSTVPFQHSQFLPGDSGFSCAVHLSIWEQSNCKLILDFKQFKQHLFMLAFGILTSYFGLWFLICIKRLFWETFLAQDFIFLGLLSETTKNPQPWIE